MSKQDADASQAAARVVRESTEEQEQPLPADLEAAWQGWSAGVGKADSRTMALLRAAFEAGAAAAQQNTNGAAALGRLGGLKGGKARAAALSPAKRQAIAKEAAAKRWGKS